jgi:hypothetical protein
VDVAQWAPIINASVNAVTALAVAYASSQLRSMRREMSAERLEAEKRRNGDAD